MPSVRNGYYSMWGDDKGAVKMTTTLGKFLPNNLKFIPH